MTERDELFLQHILDAVVDIESFTVGGRSAFLTDRKTQSAVIRQIEIIGEAVKNLSAELTGGAPGVPWRLIAGSRDRLIHAYFKVDLDMCGRWSNKTCRAFAPMFSGCWRSRRRLNPAPRPDTVAARGMRDRRRLGVKKVEHRAHGPYSITCCAPNSGSCGIVRCGGRTP